MKYFILKCLYYFLASFCLFVSFFLSCFGVLCDLVIYVWQCRAALCISPPSCSWFFSFHCSLCASVSSTLPLWLTEYSTYFDIPFIFTIDDSKLIITKTHLFPIMSPREMPQWIANVLQPQWRGLECAVYQDMVRGSYFPAFVNICFVKTVETVQIWDP